MMAKPETRPHAAAPEDDAELMRLAKRVDEAVRSAQDQGVGTTRVAFELRDAVEAFHREGLVRILRTLRAHPAGGSILPELGKDPFLQAMFGLHGFVRPDLDGRIQRGLDAARPLLAQHNGDVEFVRREDDVVFVRLLGSCTDCTLAPLTLQEAVTDAVLKLAPEVKRVELVREDRPKEKAVIEHPGEGWERGPDLADVPDGALFRFDLSKDSVLVRRNGDALRAWYNKCPHQGLGLDGGLHDRKNGDERTCTLTCPWHGWEFDVDSGECTNNKTGAPLVPVPLIEREGSIWLRP